MNTKICSINVIAMAALIASGTAASNDISEGYVHDSGGDLVMSGHGSCVRTGSWTPDMAIMQCDSDLVKVAQTTPPVEKPAARPTQAAPAQPAPAVVTIQSETLFAFDKSVINPNGRKALDDEVVRTIKKHPQIERIIVIGHTDRIGSNAYNQRLSQRRSDAVKDYLIGQGISPALIGTMAMGASEPVVSCEKISGRVSGLNKELVECLAPNRRVVVEIKNQSAERQ